MEAPSLEELGERLGIALRDPEQLRQAFVHSSYHNENPDLAPEHNERLEFYGDAVIGVVVSRLLYERHPDEDEGFLTARRAALVNREALATMATDLGLDRLLLLGRGEAEGGGASRPSVLAACFEAVAGALSLSEGAERTNEVLRRLFIPRLEALSAEGAPKSAKSRLQELTQRVYAQKPVYQLRSSTGPPHLQEFEVAALLDGRELGVGTGSSRQRAEEQAATAALEALEAEADAVVAAPPRGAMDAP